MTYLQLCQLTARILRLGNAQSGTVPTTIPVPAGSEDVVFDIADAVPRAYAWLQNQHQGWQWMRKQSFVPLQNTRALSLTTIRAQIADYAWMIPFHAGTVGYPYLMMYDSGASTIVHRPLRVVPYIEWRGLYDRMPRPTGVPVQCTEHPSRTLEFDPGATTAPSGLPWYVVLDYRMRNDVLTTVNQVPALPEHWHEVIAWIAARLVAITRQNKGTLGLDGDAVAMSYLTSLKAEQLPQMTVDLSYA